MIAVLLHLAACAVTENMDALGVLWCFAKRMSLFYGVQAVQAGRRQKYCYV